MRAVIYARYSSDNQREASIDDQVEVCRRYIEQQGWTLSTSTITLLAILTISRSVPTRRHD